MRKRLLILASILLCLAWVSTSAAADDVKADAGWDDVGFLKHTSPDGQFEMRLDVRMYMDAAYFLENKNEMRNGTTLRRGRLAVKTKMWEKWEAEFDMDIADNVVEAKDMWVSYQTCEKGFIKAGHFKIPFSLEELTSSRLITFMERAYPNVFPPGRRSALGVTRWFSKAHFSAAVYGQEFGDKESDRVSEGMGLAARGTFAPILDDEKAIHLGAGIVYQTPDDESETLEYKIEPEAKTGDTEFCNTGDIKDVDYFTLMGIEGAASYKNMYVQGEFIQNDITRLDDAEDLSFYGGYVFAGFILTGEHRPYIVKEGEFGKIIPKNKKRGALELAVRYSHINLSDYEIIGDPDLGTESIKGVQGGKANNFTVGLNWYANPNVKLIANYIYVDNSINAGVKGGLEGDDDFGIIQTRILVNF
ncbi:MAG: hypothetical protein B6244_03375 [Candidatus Cloacimonetes bacterium 4572_55]|nr:MAG: hypothetical protein B6244_03375 [Candidatus Cloacimonetes bacterium 4572_55]